MGFECTADCDFPLARDSIFTLGATPSAGLQVPRMGGWLPPDSPRQRCEVEMADQRNVVAFFSRIVPNVPTPNILAVNFASGSVDGTITSSPGSITFDCHRTGGVCSVPYVDGVVVTLNLEP